MDKDPYEPYEYEVDLRDYIMVMWDNKWLILAIIIVAIGAAFGFSQLQSPEYGASSSVLVTKNVSESLIKEFREGGFSSRILYPGIYKQTAGSEETLQAVIEQLDLKGSSGDALSVDSLKDQISVSVDYDGPNADQEQAEEEPVAQFERIPTVTFSVQDDSSKNLKDIAAKWTEVFSERINELFSNEIDKYYGKVKESFQDVQKELTVIEEKKLDYQKEKRVELLSTEIESLKQQYMQVTSRLQEQKFSLSGLEAKLSSLKKSLNSESQFIQLERGIPDEMLMILYGTIEDSEESEGGGKRLEDLRDTLEIALKEQAKNDVYFDIKREVIEVNGEIASANASVDSLQEREKALSAEIQATKDELLDANLEIQRLERDISSLTPEYLSLKQTYRDLERLRSDGVVQVQVLDSPSAAELVSPVNTKQNVAVAGVLGIFLGVLIAFFKHYMEGYEREENDEKENA